MIIFIGNKYFLNLDSERCFSSQQGELCDDGFSACELQSGQQSTCVTEKYTQVCFVPYLKLLCDYI